MESSRSRASALSRAPRCLPSAAVAVALVVAAAHPSWAEADEPWRERPHHVSLLVAGSDDDEHTAATLGLDYEYRWNALLGLGFVVEYAFEDIDAWTLLAVADVHVWRGLAIQTGPGVEFVNGEGEEDDEEEFTFRIGALYEFELGRFTFSPQIHYDVTTGADSLVFGGAIGVGF